MSRPTPQSLSTSSGQDELREQARLVKQMMALPVRENSSALVTVDLWEIADFIAHHTQEAVEAARIDELKKADIRFTNPYLGKDKFQAYVQARIAELTVLASTNQPKDKDGDAEPNTTR